MINWRTEPTRWAAVIKKKFYRWCCMRRISPNFHKICHFVDLTCSSLQKRRPVFLSEGPNSRNLRADQVDRADLQWPCQKPFPQTWTPHQKPHLQHCLASAVVPPWHSNYASAFVKAHFACIWFSSVKYNNVDPSSTIILQFVLTNTAVLHFGHIYLQTYWEFQNSYISQHEKNWEMTK